MYKYLNIKLESHEYWLLHNTFKQILPYLEGNFFSWQDINVHQQPYHNQKTIDKSNQDIDGRSTFDRYKNFKIHIRFNII